MEQNIKYYVVKDKAIPEVLIKVVEAKRLLTADKMMTVKEATDKEAHFTNIKMISFHLMILQREGISPSLFRYRMKWDFYRSCWQWLQSIMPIS